MDLRLAVLGSDAVSTKAGEGGSADERLMLGNLKKLRASYYAELLAGRHLDAERAAWVAALAPTA